MKRETPRADRIQALIESWIDAAPGSTRTEKLTHVWETREAAMNRLLAGMRHLSSYEIFGGKLPGDSQPKVPSRALRYYVRFGKLPPTGRSRAYAWNPTTRKKEPFKEEKGISAYPVKWDTKRNRWILDQSHTDSTDVDVGFDELMIDLADGKRNDAFLIHGEEIVDVGSDGEPLLDISTVTIVKRLAYYEIGSPEFDYEPSK
jgi:hypothetical protein